MRSLIKPLSMALIMCSAVAVKADTVSELENLVNKWLQIENQNNALNAHWLEQKSTMAQTLTLLNAEQKQLSQLNEPRQ